MRESDGLESYLRDLKTVVPPEREPASRSLRRQKMLPALRDRVGSAYARRRRLRVWRRIGVGAVAVGAAATIAVMVVRPRDSGTSPAVAGNQAGAEVGIGVLKGVLVLNREGARRTLGAGDDVQVGADDALETPARDSAQLQLSDVARVTLAPETRVAAIGVEHITLSKGRAHLWVAKLGAGRTFRVVTPDADVQVHGTEFDVELVGGALPRTCVRVQEGRVEVAAGSSRTVLAAGKTWGCDPAPAVRSDATAARIVTPQMTSDLRVQNQLFERALRAERAGHHAVAAETYRRLLARYPDGPLAAQARTNLAAMPAAR